ncbi:MAG TPA: hypothetical protein VLT32_21485 [Candidatus Sulfomarinibacteraceae bacterium]|nr:hypothetical protein [Candidatus Sulfomarinibacteraceae bacterium]
MNQALAVEVGEGGRDPSADLDGAFEVEPATPGELVAKARSRHQLHG